MNAAAPTFVLSSALRELAAQGTGESRRVLHDALLEAHPDYVRCVRQADALVRVTNTPQLVVVYIDATSTRRAFAVRSLHSLGNTIGGSPRPLQDALDDVGVILISRKHEHHALESAVATYIAVPPPDGPVAVAWREAQARGQREHDERVAQDAAAHAAAEAIVHLVVLQEVGAVCGLSNDEPGQRVGAVHLARVTCATCRAAARTVGEAFSHLRRAEGARARSAPTPPRPGATVLEERADDGSWHRFDMMWWLDSAEREYTITIRPRRRT